MPAFKYSSTLNIQSLDGSSQVIGCVKMKLNLTFPATGCQKLTEEHKEHKFYTFNKQYWASKFATYAVGEEHKYCMIQIGCRDDKLVS